jgi:hypothetical protein
MRQVTFVVALLIAPMATLLAQGPPSGSPSVLPPGVTLLARAPGETAVPGKCLFKEDLDLIARGAPIAPLNNDAEAPRPDYLVGRWSFDTIYQSPPGRRGRSRHRDGSARGWVSLRVHDPGQRDRPARSIKSDRVRPVPHYTIVVERDSRGVELLKSGRVGGDSGGFYTSLAGAAPDRQTKVD